jgi:hypothetical protein
MDYQIQKLVLRLLFFGALSFALISFHFISLARLALFQLKGSFKRV